MQSSVEGAIVIVKLFKNQNKKKSNDLVTRTLGKVGVINSRWIPSGDQERPKVGEFWKMRILKEVIPCKNEGCFVLEPMSRVDLQDIVKLVPGFFEEENIEGLIKVIPKKAGNWIMPLDLRRTKTCYALVVDLSDCQEPNEDKD